MKGAVTLVKLVILAGALPRVQPFNFATLASPRYPIAVLAYAGIMSTNLKFGEWT